MRTALLSVLLPALLLTMTSPAHACADPGMSRSLLHRQLPDLPAGATAVEVEIISSSNEGPPRAEARIIRVVQGRLAGSRLRLAPRHFTSCDSAPFPGERGFVIGARIADEGGIAVIDPIPGPTLSEIRRSRARRSPTPLPSQ